MKKASILLFAVITFSLSVFSQGNNCNSASAFCSGSTSYPAGVSAGTAQPGPNYGCLFSQPNPAWFFMQVSTPGNIALTITASPPRDIDFILYGPFTSPTAPCTSQLTATNTEDCSYAGGTAPEIADITGGMAGEYYLLLLTNYSNQPTNVTFSQTSGTGSTSCAVLCDISSLTATPTACSPATNSYSLSGQIAFTTPPSTGTLTVTSSCGGSQVFNAPFTSPINYNITGITANGGACNVTATFSATTSCTQTTSYTSPANCTPCSATAVNNGPVCSGNNLNLTAGAVTGATSYSWSGPGGYTSVSQNPVISGATTTASGTYTVTVTTPSATCTATTNVTVNQTPPAPTATNNGPVCSGGTLNLSTTATGVTYNWTGASGFSSTVQNPSISSVTNAATGTYSLTVTSNGCTSIAGTTSVIINNTPNPPIPNINASTNPPPICEGSNITLTANNIAGATYNWTGPNGYTATVRNPPVLTGATTLMGGTYSLTVTVGGCTSLPATVSIVVNAIPPAPTAAGTSICSGATATLTASGSGGTYDWYDSATGGTLQGTGATFTTPSLTSTTTYYVQSTNSGCTGPRTSVTVTVSPSFTVTTIPDDSICSGTSFTLGVTSPTSGSYTYSWDEPGLTGFSNSAVPIVTPATTTTYTVTLTDPIGCIGSDIITITVGTPLVLIASGTPANCYGSCDGTGNAVVSGSFSPYTYSWSNGSVTSALTGLCAGTYTVIITDLIGCTIQDTIMVTEPTPISLTTSSVASHCSQPDGSATVNASGSVAPYTFSWTPGTQTTSTATSLVPGNYCVTVTDSQGCIEDTCVTVSDTPGVTATAAATATSCNAGCDGTAAVTASSGTPPYTYLWNNGQTTATIGSLCFGTYTCTITDSAFCTYTVTATVTQPTPVVIEPLSVPPAICIGQSATLNAVAIGGTPGYTFNWSAPAFTGNPYIVSPAVNTTYTVSATDANGCVSINQPTVLVTVRPPLGVTAGNDVDICIDDNTTITATGTGGDGSYNYSWMPGSLTGSSVTVSPTSTTTYTVTLSDNCTSIDAIDSVVVTVRPKPVVNFTSNIVSGCAPSCVNFIDLSTISSGSIIGWNWSVDGATDSTQNPNHCFGTDGVYSVTLTDTSDFGCISTATITSMITIYAMPEAAFVYSPQPASINYPNISFSDQSINAGSWLWNFADSLYNPSTNTSNIPNPDHNYSEDGTYCVSLIVNNTPACADTAIQCIVIEPDFTFYIPNSFSPNGSGLNDEFFGQGENIDKFEMQIYNRWGNLIFRTEDINEHWKGNMMGSNEIAQDDVYVYIITIKDMVGERHQYIGHVTIVK